MHALIFLWQPESVAVHPLPPHDVVIAADSGLEAASRWGVHVDLAVGDFDSAADSLLADTEARGGEIIRVPAEKDKTDAELAIAIALERGATAITIVGSSQGRADHALAIQLGLGVSTLADCDVRAWLDDTHVFVLRSSVSLDTHQGRRVSLVPLYGDVTGVTTNGLRYALTDATLHVGSAFSLSNEFTAEATTASVSIASGTLLVLQSPMFR